jgi:hypothetical protein
VPLTELTLSLPLDDDGFLRRECPHCEREFKWWPSDESDEPADGGYFCPYCGRQADGDAWWTKAQLEAAEATVAREVVDPGLDKLGESVRGLISARFERGPRRSPVKLTEPNDMRRVDFACHPNEPVKVADEWNRSVHCLLCGSAGGA